jgi:hypothetical protein
VPSSIDCTDSVRSLVAGYKLAGLERPGTPAQGTLHPPVATLRTPEGAPVDRRPSEHLCTVEVSSKFISHRRKS